VHTEPRVEEEKAMTMGDRLKPAHEQHTIAEPSLEGEDSRAQRTDSADDHSADSEGSRLIEEEALIDAPGS
jgi:hypothetical protein